MTTIRLSSKGQIVIPKLLREARNWRPGMILNIDALGQELRIRPSLETPLQSVEAGLGLLAKHPKRVLSKKQTEQKIAELISKQDKASRKK